MNYLAHLFLAKPTAASRAGNFLGDFITGTPESLADTLPPDLIDGIMMHRHIDAFTDSHPNFKTAKEFLSPERRRFAGIIVDMFADHFLAKNWEQYSTQSLSDFTKETKDLFHTLWDYFPENAQREATWMIEGKWFLRYQSIDGLEKSLTGIGNSRNRFTPIIGSSETLKEHYGELQKLCETILSDAREKYT